MIRTLCLAALLFTGGLAAAEGDAAAPAIPAAAKVYLGLFLNEGVTFDGQQPQVSKVVTGATADRLGLRPGDRIGAINGTPTPDLDRFRAAVGGLVPGEALRLTVLRDGATIELTGTGEAAPRPREVLTDADDLRAEIQRLRDDAERIRMRSRLEEQLRLLKEFEAGLPAAAAEFKRLYPDGTFDISIRIDIRSSPSAAHQVPLLPAATGSASAAGPATASPRR